MKLRPSFRAALALALCASLLACGPLDVVKAASAEISVNLQTADAFVNAFERLGHLTADAAAEKRASFARLGEKYAPLDAAIQRVKKLDASAAVEVLPLAKAFYRQLQAENIVPDVAPEIAKRFADVRAVLELVAARIVARLKSKAGTAAEYRREADELKGRAAQLTRLLNAPVPGQGSAADAGR